MATATWTINRRNRWGRWALVAVGVIVLSAIIGLGGLEWWRSQQAAQQRAAIALPPTQGVTELAISNFAYGPAHVQIRAGTTLTWTNADNVEHDVILLDGSGRSPMLGNGQGFSHTFTTPGTFQYVCSDHPFMIGQVTVVE